MPKPNLPVIFVVSDGRGETCVQWLRAALVQFPSQEFDLVTWSEVLIPQQVEEIVGQAARRGATIFRVHDVAALVRALTVAAAIEKPSSELETGA